MISVDKRFVPSNAQAVDVFDAIRLRRSLKPELLKPDPVDRALLERLLEAANWAPSHGLTEPWRFIVFQGEARRGLLDAVVETMQNPGEGRIPDADPRRTGMAAKMLNAPVCIAIICQASPSPKIVEHEEIASTAMAVENMHLAARALGLGAFWTSGKKAFAPSMAAFLGIEAPARCLGFFYVGWPNVPWPEGARKPWQDKVRWEG
ncbi:MAG: nitroreductase [Myxococcota bacterium]